MRDEGLLDFTRGRGVRVAGTAQECAVLARINELLDYARQQGFHREEALGIIEGQDAR